ncbi:MAG TPA: hypothetical protein V6D11_12660 [Waterburya sp.]
MAQLYTGIVGASACDSVKRSYSDVSVSDSGRSDSEQASRSVGASALLLSADRTSTYIQPEPIIAIATLASLRDRTAFFHASSD